MKRFFTSLGFTRPAVRLLVLFTTTTLTSCQKENLVSSTTVHTEPSIPTPHTRTTYTSVPAPTTSTSVSAYSAYSSPSVILNGSSGSHNGGYIRAKVVSQSGNQFVIQISRQNGAVFPNGTTAKLRMGSVSYTTLATGSASSGATTINITLHVSVGTGYGVLDVFPTVKVGSTNYFAEPIVIYTSPAHNVAKFNYTYVNSSSISTLGTINAVSVNASQPGTNLNFTGTNYWQCTEFCKRYYSQVYGMNFTYGNAGTWWNNASSYGLYAVPVGQPPRVGDILEFYRPNNTAGQFVAGHVMIVNEVKSNSIIVSHQNGGTNAPLRQSFSIVGNTVPSSALSSWSGALFKGFLRKP